MSLFSLLKPALAALLLQGACGGLLVLAAGAAYGAHPRIGEGAALGSLYAALVLAGVVAGAVALRGLHRLHLERAPGAAFLWTAVAYVPVLVVSTFSTVALLMFLRAW